VRWENKAPVDGCTLSNKLSTMIVVNGRRRRMLLRGGGEGRGGKWNTPIYPFLIRTDGLIK